MPTDKQLVSLCYSILKQLELKHIDWKLVAADNAIQNPHAARMRYSRFKTQMERASLATSQKQAEKRKREAEKGGKEKNGAEKGCGSAENVESVSDGEEMIAVAGKRVKGEGIVKREDAKVVEGRVKVEEVKREGRLKAEVEEIDEDVKMGPMDVIKMEEMGDEGRIWGGLKYEVDDDCFVEGVRSVRAVF
ncbi:hypothetical protein BU16DRAFT_621913 [Lophium mytilinum]|uniref:Myb-like DNA-binding domain-containing protein n=1 Tax=Lophium mytilinum TaxID=390894 RepID=A0A6A6QFJ9_9PEZI|nr:hypothetical protein BU16DRAFT_621913 [Lophium mytilinum]